MADESGWANQLIAGLGVAVTALGTWAWNSTHKKIDDMAAKIPSKESLDSIGKRIDDHTLEDNKQQTAIKDELTLHRGHIAKIFDRLTDMDATSEQRYRELTEKSHEQHVALLNAIHEMRK